MKKDNIMECVAVCERAEDKFGMDYLNATYGKRISRIMDLQSAVEVFNLRLDELSKADDENFYHDVFGIWGEANRETFPCSFGMFVPRFAGY